MLSRAWRSVRKYFARSLASKPLATSDGRSNVDSPSSSSTSRFRTPAGAASANLLTISASFPALRDHGREAPTTLPGANVLRKRRRDGQLVNNNNGCPRCGTYGPSTCSPASAPLIHADTGFRRAFRRCSCRRGREGVRQGGRVRSGARRRDSRLSVTTAHGSHGALRLREVDADALPRRSGLAHVRLHGARRHRPLRHDREGAHDRAPGSRGVHLPSVQPRPDPHRDREHHASGRPRPAPDRSGLARPDHRCDRSRTSPRPPPGTALRGRAATGGNRSSVGGTT